jgi:hypothetical protein
MGNLVSSLFLLLTCYISVRMPFPTQHKFLLTYMRFDVLTAVRMSMLLLWVVTPCELVGRYQRFGETYCLHLQGRKWKQYYPPKLQIHTRSLFQSEKVTWH